jgi:tRNA wybutosine-synthesizing protein 1
LFSDHWERLNESLEHLARKKQRTCIRLTAVKGLNMVEPARYAELISKGDPDFLEVKAYMHVGASQRRLSRENMPTHEEVVAFTKEILKDLPGYGLVAEHIPSRVVMVAKKSYRKDGKWRTWIDFPKYRELALSGREFSADDYLKETPASSVGISGNGTPTREEAVARKREREARLAKVRANSKQAMLPAENVEETELD